MQHTPAHQQQGQNTKSSPSEDATDRPTLQKSGCGSGWTDFSPSENGHQYILTLVDYDTRYPEAIALKRSDTPTVAEALVDMFSRLGIPEEIFNDLGTQFVLECMEEVNRLLSIRHLTTTPMCNGLVDYAKSSQDIGTDS